MKTLSKKNKAMFLKNEKTKKKDIFIFLLLNNYSIVVNSFTFGNYAGKSIIRAARSGICLFP